MSISRSFATIAFSALPAGPISLVRTFSSIVSETVVSCCCALLPKKMIELLSVTSSSRIACATCCSTGPSSSICRSPASSWLSAVSWFASGSAVSGGMVTGVLDLGRILVATASSPVSMIRARQLNGRLRA